MANQFGKFTLASLEAAQDGELVLCDVLRHSRHSDGFSQVEHVCEVLHKYGARNERWVRPICGAPTGRAGTHVPTFPVCRRCQRKANRL